MNDLRKPGKYILISLSLCLLAYFTARTYHQSSLKDKASFGPSVVVETSPTVTSALPPAHCFGLFVALDDHDPDSITFQRYRVGEPISVTVTVLVFDAGHLLLTEGRFWRDYTISVTDRQGHSLPMTEYGQRITNNDRSPNIGGIRVDRDTPYRVQFRIDKWFDFSHPGVYTINLTRRVWVAGAAQTITGNTVSISIIPPPPPP